MGYTLKVFIGTKDGWVPILEKYKESIKVDFKNGISMIPMTDELFDEINELENSAGISTFKFLTSNIEQKIIQVIGSHELAYVESQFFGGQGGHIGIICKDGKREFLTEFDKSCMNKILKKLGVIRTILKDEFDTIGLAENRHTEDWIE